MNEADKKRLYKRKAGNIPLHYKIAIALGSLVFFLFLTEIGLRITGALFFSRDQEMVRFGDERSTNRVMCVGDSFTWGGRSPRQDAYPALLSSVLAEKFPKKNFAVINRGVCETNSRYVMEKLPSWIEDFNPTIIVLLVGSTNRFNAWNFDPLLKEKEGFTESWFSNVRIVKVAEIIWAHRLSSMDVIERAFYRHIPVAVKESVYSRFNLYESFIWRWERIVKETKAVRSDPLFKLWHAIISEKAPLSREKELAGIASKSVSLDKGACALAHFYYLHDQYGKCEKTILDALRADPDSELLLNAAGFYYRTFCNKYMERFAYDQVVGTSLKAIEYDPIEYYNYYRLAKAFDLQSRYEARDVYAQLERLKNKNTVYDEVPWFKTYVSIFTDKHSWEKKVSDWVSDDLEEIVKICKAKNIELIFQNYPVSYPMVNRVLRTVAKKHSLPFVDNLSLFNTLTPRDRYILDDDHCTRAGHQVMAENITGVLADSLK